MQRAVTAIYPSFATASLVREDLEQLGLGRHHVTVIPDGDRGATSFDTGASGTPGTAFGTSSGAFVAATPTYADANSGYSGADAAYGDAFDRLHSLDLPEEDTRVYQQAIRNGDYIVSVQVDDDADADLARIQEVMRHPEDAYDLDDLDTRYSGAEYVPRGQDSGLQMAAGSGASDAGYGSQQQGFASSGSMGQTTGYGGSGSRGYTGETQYNDDGTIKVIEEDLAVGKRAVERGAVRVRSYVREEPVSAEVDLRAERVYLERRPVDRAVTSGDIGMQDQVLEARETVEEAVVSKQARVVEEIGLRKETEVDHQTIQDTVRKTEVEIEDTRTGDTNRLTGDRDRDRSGY